MWWNFMNNGENPVTRTYPHKTSFNSIFYLESQLKKKTFCQIIQSVNVNFRFPAKLYKQACTPICHLLHSPIYHSPNHPLNYLSNGLKLVKYKHEMIFAFLLLTMLYKISGLYFNILKQIPITSSYECLTQSNPNFRTSVSIQLCVVFFPSQYLPYLA